MKSKTILVSLGTVALVAACAHDDGRAQSTVITSGAAPSGVRVTNVVEERSPAERLAGELCMHDAACNRSASSGNDEARLLNEQACVTERWPAADRFVGSWSCAPAASRARFEECLAAIRSERCETRLDDPGKLTLCRGNAVCPETAVRSAR